MRRFALLAALCATPAAAQQVLYTPVPPKGSAYVRFANALDGALSVSPDFLPAQTLGANGAERVSAYAVVEHVAGRMMSLDATAGARHGHAAITASAGSFMTVILRPDGTGGIAAVAVTDETDFNQTRSHLAFYNATSQCSPADLKLQPANAAVFADVAPGTAKSRSVNPVTATVIPDCGTTPTPAVALAGLVAGGMYSIWLTMPTPGQPATFVSRDQTLPYKP